MKKAVILVFLFWSALAQAQILKPYTLQFSLSKKEVKAGETVDVLIDARMNPGWHIFSSDQDPDVGPLPAVIKFKKNGTFETVGKLRPTSTPTEKMDEIFGGKVRYFEGKGSFKQTIRILKEGAKIEGSLGGQVCQDDGVCIAINDGDFSLANLKVLPGEAPKDEKKTRP